MALRFPSAVVVLFLALPSGAFSQSFNLSAPRQAGSAGRVSFGAPSPVAPTAAPDRPVAPGLLNLKLPPEVLAALLAETEPCRSAPARDRNALPAGRAADKWPILAGIAELVGSLFADASAPADSWAHSLAERTPWTTTGAGGPPLPRSALGCPPAKPTPVRRAPVVK